jgi:hypothetical protein
MEVPYARYWHRSGEWSSWRDRVLTLRVSSRAGAFRPRVAVGVQTDGWDNHATCPDCESGCQRTRPSRSGCNHGVLACRAVAPCAGGRAGSLPPSSKAPWRAGELGALGGARAMMTLTGFWIACVLSAVGGTCYWFRTARHRPNQDSERFALLLLYVLTGLVTAVMLVWLWVSWRVWQ